MIISYVIQAMETIIMVLPLTANPVRTLYNTHFYIFI